MIDDLLCLEFDVSKIAEDFEASSTQFLKTFEELMVILSERLPSVVPSLSTTVFAMMNHDHFPLRVFVTLISSIHLSVMNTLQSIQGMTYQADRIDSLSDDMESSAKDMNIISMNVKSLCESISFTLLYKMITRMANHLDKILTEKYSDWHANEKGSKGLRPVTIANHISVHMSRILISLHICLEYLSTAMTDLLLWLSLSMNPFMMMYRPWYVLVTPLSCISIPSGRDSSTGDRALASRDTREGCKTT